MGRRIRVVQQNFHDAPRTGRDLVHFALFFHVAEQRARLQEFRRGVVAIVFEQIRMNLGVSLQIRLHPVIASPFVSLPMVLRTRRDDSLDVPLIGVKEKPNHRTLIINLAVTCDDHARFFRCERGVAKSDDQQEQCQEVLHASILSTAVKRVHVVLRLFVIDEHRRVSAVQVLFEIRVAVLVFVLRVVARVLGIESELALPRVRHPICV